MLRLIIIGAVVIASVTAPLLIRHHAQLQANENDQLLRQQAERLAELSAENRRLSKLLSQTPARSVSDAQFHELLRLRGEIGQLRQTVSEMEKLRAANQQLRSAREPSAEQRTASPPPENQTILAHWPKAELAATGYGDPVSALKTALWAMRQGDTNALVGSVTPDARAKMLRQGWWDQGNPADELAASARMITDSLGPSSGFYVVGQDLKAQDQAVLDVYFDGEGKTRKFTLKKIGEAWRLNDLGGGQWP